MIGKQGYSLPVQRAAIMVAILLLLVAVDAIHVLVVRQIREGQKTTCLSNMKLISLALRMYMDDYGDRLPTSKVVSLSGSVPNVGFCTTMGVDVGSYEDEETVQWVWNTAASELRAYSVSSDDWFCPSDSVVPGRHDERVSYFYRPAVDMAASHGLHESDFRYPASQIVFFDRLDLHSAGSPRGWVNGASFNVAFMDGHVASVSTTPGTSSGVGIGQITTSSDGVLKRSLSTPGWPCWFNFDTKTGKAVRSKAWDPRRYKDAVE